MANGDIGIGKIIDQERYRDAIHIAVAPVEAGQDLSPGQRICLIKGKAFAEFETCVGIVDPFLVHKILPGERFYCFLFPGTITSLRHAWIHPAFEGTDVDPVKEVPNPDKAASEAWLREYAKRVNTYYAKGGYYYEKSGVDESYKILMDDLAGNTITYHGIDMHGRHELIDEAELKRHGEIVLGRPINFDSFEYFSCSC